MARRFLTRRKLAELKGKNLPYALIALVMIVIGCADVSGKNSANIASAANDGAITERYWKLVELRGQPVANVGAREPHIILKEKDQRVAGSGGCNSLMGGYQITAPNRISFSKVASTMMACSQGMDTERGLFEVLETADSYTVNGDTLVLNRARMAPLARFEAVYLQ